MKEDAIVMGGTEGEDASGRQGMFGRFVGWARRRLGLKAPSPALTETASAPKTSPPKTSPPKPSARAAPRSRRTAKTRSGRALEPIETLAEGYPITGVRRQGRAERPTLILIHGAGMDHRDWTFGFLDALPGDQDVIAYDRPGFGGSGRPRISGALPATQARLLKLATQALGVGETVLVGHSWGGAVAMAWGLQDPDGVRGVASLAGAVAPWSLASSIAHGRRMREAARTAFTGAGPRQAALEAMAESFAPQEIPEGFVEHIETDMSKGGLLEGPAAALAQDIATINGALGMQVQNYGAFPRPVELVYGDADRIVSYQEQAEVAAAALPDAMVTILRGAGHMIHHTHRADCVKAIARLYERAAAKAVI